MKTLRAVLLVILLLTATMALASPLFGTWKGELNGRPISLVVTYGGGRVDGNLVLTSTDASPRQLHLTNAHTNRPPTVLTFQVPNQDGGVKLISTAGDSVTFELEWSGGNEGVLRVVGASAPAIKMVRQK